MRIYRAANDDYISQGYSFAADLTDAKAYLDNPGFGGDTLFLAEIPPDRVLDLTEDDPWETLSEAVGREIIPDHGGGFVSQALQLQPGLIDDIASAGYDWVKYVDDYPPGCITFTICSAEAEQIYLEEIDEDEDE